MATGVQVKRFQWPNSNLTERVQEKRPSRFHYSTYYYSLLILVHHYSRTTAGAPHILPPTTWRMYESVIFPCPNIYIYIYIYIYMYITDNCLND